MTKPRDLVLGTAGHIDHGKTALVRALTGVDTDRLPAEKQRGITIDLGFAALDLGNIRLALVDVPGHERFIRNMLAGATGLDLALLVVAADDSVMPQTREHLEILRLLGLAGGVVALTKCDLADPAWLDLVEEEVRTLVAGSFLEGAEVVRTSAATGSGIEELKAALGRLAASAPPRDDPGAFRMAIDRAFTVAGHGTVVTGTVASGRVAVGDELRQLPDGRAVRVRGLHRHDRPVDAIGRGARAAINLAGVHHDEIRRGHELAATGYLEPTRALSVEVRPAREAPYPLRHRGRYRLHLGTAEVTATLSLLDRAEMGQDGPVIGQLLTAEPVVAVAGEPFVLRSESPPATLGGGRVLQPVARRLRRRDRDAIDRLDRLRSPDPATRVGAALAFQGLRPWTESTLSRDTGLPVVAVESALARLEGDGSLVELAIGPRRTARVLREVAEGLEDRVARALGRLHEAKPRASLVRRDHLAAELPDLDSDALIAALLDRLKGRGLVVGDARAVALKGHGPKLSQAERRLKDDLAAALRAGGLSPPDFADLTALAGPRAPALPELLALLIEEETIVEVGHRLYLDAEADAELRRLVVARLSDGSAITMAELRDLLGTTRKYAVPLGEYLDRLGLTLRDGDLRRLGPAAEISPSPP
ncbi:MAG TPA: selenocysteine-specific translation elongation factor [Isosphaeraceae bacterium]|jgi:selenocysteine-specific elongation factor|nr:selenocysteine-specific translation elongation factor [Isosphaeraceae bacterium]